MKSLRQITFGMSTSSTALTTRSALCCVDLQLKHYDKFDLVSILSTCKGISATGNILYPYGTNMSWEKASAPTYEMNSFYANIFITNGSTWMLNPEADLTAVSGSIDSNGTALNFPANFHYTPSKPIPLNLPSQKIRIQGSANWRYYACAYDDSSNLTFYFQVVLELLVNT